MPVLHVIAAARRGGAERLLWLIGRELQQSGVQVPVRSSKMVRCAQSSRRLAFGAMSSAVPGASGPR